jgi:hypothetical protein
LYCTHWHFPFCFPGYQSQKEKYHITAGEYTNNISHSKLRTGSAQDMHIALTHPLAFSFLLIGYIYSQVEANKIKSAKPKLCYLDVAYAKML